MSNFLPLLKLAVIILCIIFRRFLLSLPELLYWWYKDLRNFDRDVFYPYGVWMFVGKQGSGKTMSLVNHLEKLRRRYPKAKIYTNMGYTFETAPLKGLTDLLNKDNYNGKSVKPLSGAVSKLYPILVYILAFGYLRRSFSR